MKLRLGWGPKITAQFAIVILPLAVLLLVQAWLDVQRSARLADVFPLHLKANAARKSYKQFVDGATDAVDSGKLAAKASEALRKALESVHEIALRAQSEDLATVQTNLELLSGKLGNGGTLQDLLPLRSAIASVNEGIQKLDEKYEEQTRFVISEAQRSARQQVLAVWGVAALALLLTVYFVRTMIARMTNPLKDGIRVAQAIAVGDLSAARSVDGEDETAQLINALAGMTEALRGIVGEVRQSSDDIHSASIDIATGNQDLSARTENAASNLQRTAASVEQITRTVKQSAGNASRANQLATSASDVATKGGEVIGRVVTTMGEIESSSKKISDIIGVIDSIAFQTNILALNAAVEAARAGEQGRGFAVVAGEVRALAHRSADAAREIKNLIRESVNKVQSGSSLVVEAGRTMREIVEQVRHVSGLIAEINLASSSQAGEIERLQDAIGELERMTQQNASLVEQSAASSESMRTLAVSLKQAVSLFRLEGSMDRAATGVSAVGQGVAGAPIQFGAPA